MVGHGGSSAGSYFADPTSPIPSHCASIVTTSTVRVKILACMIENIIELESKFTISNISIKKRYIMAFVIDVDVCV